ncbi:MAG: C15orf41 family protein [archaeon]|nr:C15orf41 family protein [archaeon]
MEYGEYKRLYNSLNTVDDIDRFIEEGYERNLLETLHTQKVNREVKKNYHRAKPAVMYKMWMGGRSFCDIAKQFKFPPVLTAMMIFQYNGTSRKNFWEYVRHPELLDDKTAAEELREANQKDLAYSLEANEKARIRGKWGEGFLWDWLDEQGIEYHTEDEGRTEGAKGKTPDCLLAVPMMFEGQKIYWIESKASFGDSIEFKTNAKKQLIPYTEIFGPGIVVYWTGHLDGLQCPPGVIIEDKNILGKKLELCSEEE